jgi:tetratricopeptide (TPR) repeat protein
MPPEQALGQIDQLDERADVFALGAILCEILTGEPPYRGAGLEVLSRAARADQADALARLESCGADVELRALATRCLAPDPSARPRNAGEVAAAVTTYFAGVQARLRQAELERVEAETRAEEEAKRRALADELAREAEARADEEAKGHELADRLAREAEARARSERHRRRITVGLAASVLALAGLGGGSWLSAERSRVQRRAAVVLALDEARRRHKLARDAEADDPARWGEALAALENAEGLLAQGGDLQQKREADALKESLKADRQAARKEAEWLERLVDIRVTKASSTEGSAAEASYAGLFREAEIDPDTLEAEVAAELIQHRKPMLRQRLVAALDDWAAVRRTERKDTVAARRLLAVARLADSNPWRNRLRAALDQPGGKDRLEAIRELAGEAQVEELPAVSLDLLAVSLLDEGDATAAADLLRKAQEVHPMDGWLKYNLARSLEKLGRTDEAIRYFMAARTIHPETAHELAHILENNREPYEAIAVFRHLSRLKPKNPRNFLCLGRALKDQGRTQEAHAALDAAIVLYREWISRNPQDHQAHRLLGGALDSKGEFGKAIAEFQTAIRIDPEYAEAHGELGATLEDQGKLDEAIAEFRAAIRIKPDFTAVHVNLGLALYKKGKLDEAIAEFRAAIRIKPDLADAHSNLGNALHRQGKVAEAIAEHREAIRLKPDYAVAHSNLGAILCDVTHDYATAAAAFREAIRLKPDYAEAHANLGNALRHQGKLSEAIAAYREAIRLKPEYAEAHTNLGVALHGQGKLAESISEYREAIRLKPEFAVVHNNLAWALAVRSMRPQGDYAEALEHARKAVELAPKHGNSFNTLALAEYRSGHWTESLAASERSMALTNGGVAFDWFFLALGHGQRGDKDQARKWFEKAVAWTKTRAPKNKELLQFWTEAAELLGQPGPGAKGFTAPAEPPRVTPR